MALTCPSCGNDRNFLVKTLQMHVVQVRDDTRVEANEEGRPAVIEVLCDECEKELNFSDFDESVIVAFRADPLAEDLCGRLQSGPLGYFPRVEAHRLAAQRTLLHTPQF